MKSDIEALRQALAAGPTPGPWNACEWVWQEHTGDTSACGISVAVGQNETVIQTTAMEGDSEADVRYIAAASPDRIARLLDALELAQRDADRYRFLNRDFSVMGANIDGNHSWAYRRNFSLRGPTLDAAIDEAMKDKP